MIRAIVTDIEGTTSSLAFVKDVLFPYAATRFPSWIRENRNDPAVRRETELVAQHIDRPASDIDAVAGQLLEWIAQDVKSTPLKALQGMLWKSGYECGDYRAHVYEDAVQKLQDWHAAGIPLYVYSSGSVQAQKLFFQYSRYGDLRKLFTGYFDTTTGAKNDVAAYEKIAAAIDIPAAEVLFLSDVESELDAAMAAGMQTTLLIRPEDSAVDADATDFAVAENFYEVAVEIS